ncbi:MAG: FtsX-like permease family protein [Pseudomonadota bacterium]
MGSFHLIRKNLTRKKLRTLFTLLSIIIAFILFSLLGGLSRAFSLGVELAGADRLITMHRVSFIQPIPLSYVARVRAIEGVETAVHQTWFGAYYQNNRQQIGLFPTDLESWREVYPEYSIPDEQWRGLLANQTGVMIGQAMAETYGWSIGDRVPLFSSIYPQQDGSFSWDVDIEGIFTGSGNRADEMQAFMHYDYFNESRAFGQDTVGWIVTKIEDPDQADQVATAIDRRFANSPTETKSSTEAGWTAGFAAQIGNIGLMVRMVLACVFFTLLLITGNTMAQAVRERTSELAVMKTIGFSDRRVLLMVLGESLLVAMLGGAIGLTLGYLFMEGAASSLSQFLPGLSMAPSAALIGLLLSFGLGLVTGIVPAWQAGRLKVIDALARG